MKLSIFRVETEEAGYIRRERILTKAASKVRPRVTPEGGTAFRACLEGLKAYLIPEVPDPRSDG